jgi:4,5-DOPA dioxygenase extradiol
VRTPLQPAPAGAAFDAFLRDSAPASRTQRPWTPADGAMPGLYISHGAPPLFDDPLWISELFAWSQALPKPTAILIVSAHWEAAPLSLSASGSPLVYDFGGFHPRYYRMTYPTPDASALAARVSAAMPATEPVHERAGRGLDHGAWVPLKIMYPSGFMTHGLPFLSREAFTRNVVPSWSAEFDHWAADALSRGDVDTLAAYQDKAPGLPYAHPTVEHYTPLFITLGAAATPDEPVQTAIEGYQFGLSKRSFQVR